MNCIRRRHIRLRIPDTVWNAFKDEKKLDDVKLEKESGRALQHVVTKTGDCYRYEADVTFTEGTRGFSIGVRLRKRMMNSIPLHLSARRIV